MLHKIFYSKTKQYKWGLSMIEKMCQYLSITGFKPIGTHRRLLDEIFWQHWKSSMICDGCGVVDANELFKLKEWADCPMCKGLGGFYLGSEEEWEKLIFTVIPEYPNSAGGDFKKTCSQIYNKYAEDLILNNNTKKVTHQHFFTSINKLILEDM
jgi:hypothetical protein